MKEHTYPLKMDHIAAGVCYYPEHWGETYWKKDLQLMKELGLETARVGEFAWNFFEPREGVYDFALFDRFLDGIKKLIYFIGNIKAETKHTKHNNRQHSLYHYHHLFTSLSGNLIIYGSISEVPCILLTPVIYYSLLNTYPGKLQY